MTSITLPLKDMPGQRLRLPTFFGGRTIMVPSIPLLTIPFMLYLCCRLSQGTMLLYNLIGLLPYLFGSVSIVDGLKKSGSAVERIFGADLDEAEKIFEGFRSYYRRVLISNGFFSLIMMAIFSYLSIAYGTLSFLIIGMSSITSMGIAVPSIMSPHDPTSILIFLFFAFTLEAGSLIAALRGQWQLLLVLALFSLFIMYKFLNQLERYDLRSFFERVIN